MKIMLKIRIIAILIFFSIVDCATSFGNDAKRGGGYSECTKNKISLFSCNITNGNKVNLCYDIDSLEFSVKYGKNNSNKEYRFYNIDYSVSLGTVESAVTIKGKSDQKYIHFDLSLGKLPEGKSYILIELLGKNKFYCIPESIVYKTWKLPESSKLYPKITLINIFDIEELPYTRILNSLGADKNDLNRTKN